MVLDVPGRGRLLVFALGLGDSGIPGDRYATTQRPGVTGLEDLSPQTVQQVASLIARLKRPRDLALILPTLDLCSNGLPALEMHPRQMWRLRLNRAKPQDDRWIGEVLARESAVLETGIQFGADWRMRWAR